MQKRSVTVWWGIPCKSMIPVFRALYERHGRDVLFVALRDLPANRKLLGWVLTPVGDMPFRLLGEYNWQEEAREILVARPGLHIVNGIYHDSRVRFLLGRVREEKLPYGIIMEAPSNLETGWRRFAKGVIAPLLNPLRTQAPARDAEFVLSASGDRHADFRRLGFAADRIYPFGYFPDYPALNRSPIDPVKPHLLCIGYLEPFKGQDCLLKAVGVLRDRGVDVSCTVTGFGSAHDSLLALRDRLGLQQCVDFPGVVSNERLQELFRGAAMLVAPGLEEPWGIRVNEGLLAGLPVVVSDGVGAKEIVESTGGGAVFRAADPASLADAIAATLSRLGPGGDVALALAHNRKKITPAAAADYLEAVITYGEAPNTPRPVNPPWRRAAAAPTTAL